MNRSQNHQKEVALHLELPYKSLISAQVLSPGGEMVDEVLNLNDINANISINSIVLTDLFHY